MRWIQRTMSEHVGFVDSGENLSYSNFIKKTTGTSGQRRYNLVYLLKDLLITTIRFGKTEVKAGRTVRTILIKEKAKPAAQMMLLE